MAWLLYSSRYLMIDNILIEASCKPFKTVQRFKYVP